MHRTRTRLRAIAPSLYIRRRRTTRLFVPWPHAHPYQTPGSASEDYIQKSICVAVLLSHTSMLLTGIYWFSASVVAFLSASLYFSKRGAYWDRLCRDVVGWLSRACTVAKRCILGPRPSYYGTLIGTPTPGIQWYKFRPPGVTPNRGIGPPWGAFCQITLTSCCITGPTWLNMLSNWKSETALKWLVIVIVIVIIHLTEQIKFSKFVTSLI